MKNLFAIILVVFTIVGINYARMTDTNDLKNLIQDTETPPSVFKVENDSLNTPAELSDAMTAQGKIMEAHGKVMEKHGKEMEKLGKQMENSRVKDMEGLGREMDKLGKVMDSLGKIMDRHGKIMDKLGKKMEIAHQKFYNQFFRDLKKDGLIESLEGKISFYYDDNVMVVNGKNLDAMQVTKYKKAIEKYWGRPLKEDASLYIKGTMSTDSNGNINIKGNFNQSL